jgi:predicted transcriptional regulator of viral defense system
MKHPDPYFDNMPTSLPNWLRGRASHVEISVLWTMQLFNGLEGITIEDVASECNMSTAELLEVFEGLAEKGWVLRDPWRSNIWSISPAREKQKLPKKKLEVSSQLLLECGGHKGTLFVFCWLQAYEAMAPSIATIAEMCGMKTEDVRTCIHWLEAYEWIQRIERPGKTCVYRVFTEKA